MYAIKITIGVLLFSICALFGLRFVGLSSQYQTYDNALLKQTEPWIIAWGGDGEIGPAHSLTALKGATKMQGVILGLNIRMNAQNHFYSLPQDFNLPQGFEGKSFQQLSDNEVSQLDLGDGKPPTQLEEILKLFAQTPLFLWISDNESNVDLRLEPILKKSAHPENILIHSEYDNIPKSVKVLMPQVLFGTGIGQRIRLLMLGSFWLEPMATLDGDFVITPIAESGVNVLSPVLRDEVHRRKKRFIIGPLNDQDAIEKAIQFGASGYLTSLPQLLKKRLMKSEGQ